ncbi:hypothetical protein AMECASPLE_034825 [Ameca splendens]|uniref:Uncharacterized protein n=1 Tax=Ameca splendens TaxID=208324 RepID=A0ABV0Y739_9TELE
MVPYLQPPPVTMSLFPPPSFTHTFTKTEALLVIGRFSATCISPLEPYSVPPHTLTGKWRMNFVPGQCLNVKIPVATDVMKRETFAELHYHWTAFSLPGHTLSHVH